MIYRLKTSQKLYRLLIPLLFLCCLGSCQSKKKIQLPTQKEVTYFKKPNVLLVVIDDLKPLLGSYGDPYAQSPNIDKIASNGTVFRSNYCQQAICGPSRANLLTGLRPDHTRVWDLATKMRDENPSILTLPQYFKENGYTTAGIGKVFDNRCVDKDLDAPSWSIPFFKNAKSYYAEESYAPGMKFQDALTYDNIKKYKREAKTKGLVGSEANRYVTRFAYPTTECLDLPDNAYIDGAKVNRAIDIIKDLSGNKEPFFLAVGITKPHLPFTAPKKYWDLYDRDELPLAKFRENSENTPTVAYHSVGEMSKYKDIHPIAKFSDEKKGMELPIEKQKELIHGYYAAVSYADALVGKLMSALDALKITDNTIIVVVGDHGWHLGDHNLWCKHSNFENAVQTPLIISTSGYEANENYAMTEFVDLFPTLCELAKLEIPNNLDGVSLVPIINNPEAKVKEYAVSQYPRGKSTMGYSMRTEQFRYTIWVGGSFRTTESFQEDLVVGTELYDYKNDPFETVNVATDPKYSTTVELLHADMLAFMAKQ